MTNLLSPLAPYFRPSKLRFSNRQGASAACYL